MRWFTRTARRQDERLARETQKVSGALEAFREAVAATPVIGQAKIRRELKWLRLLSEGGLFVGTLPEVAAALEQNLRRDVTMHRRVEFQVAAIVDRSTTQVVQDVACAQIAAVIGYRTVNRYRVWRSTAELLVLFGESDDMILPDRESLGRIVPSGDSDDMILPDQQTLGRIVTIVPDRGALAAEYEQVARRLAALMEVTDEQFGRLGPQLKEWWWDEPRIDAFVRGDEPTPDGLADRVEARAIGHRLDREGGITLMRQVAERAHVLSRRGDAIEEIAASWNSIGGWLA